MRTTAQLAKDPRRAGDLSGLAKGREVGPVGREVRQLAQNRKDWLVGLPLAGR